MRSSPLHLTTAILLLAAVACNGGATRKSGDCGPAATEAEGEGTGATENAAITAAQTNARTRAGALCTGSCPDVTHTCNYLAEGEELLEVGPHADGGFQAKVKSKGSCVCEAPFPPAGQQPGFVYEGTSRGCGPASIKATGSGTGNTQQLAIQDAQRKARARAGALCTGRCDPATERCVYVATSESVDSVTQDPASQVWSATVTTHGGARCEAP